MRGAIRERKDRFRSNRLVPLSIRRTKFSLALVYRTLSPDDTHQKHAHDDGFAGRPPDTWSRVVNSHGSRRMTLMIPLTLACNRTESVSS
jgi:hypothetical protein